MSDVALKYIEARGFHLRGFVGGAAMGLCGAAVVGSAPLVSFSPTTLSLLSICGWLCFVAGAALRFWATLYVGGRKVGGRREAALTVVGPYSITRNPLYLGSFLIGLAFTLWLGSVVPLLALCATALHYALVTVPDEERFLRGMVGSAEFDAYCRRTPRFLPKPSLYHAPADTTAFIKALRNEARRFARLLAAACLIALLGILRHGDLWPQWYRLP